MKTLIYTRGKDATKQIEICEEYAKENGLLMVGSTDNENEFTSLVLSGNIDCVIVAHASRISRRREQYEATEYMLRGFGVKLIAAEGATIQ